jgi:hypothetical protein
MKRPPETLELMKNNGRGNRLATGDDDYENVIYENAG